MIVLQELYDYLSPRYAAQQSVEFQAAFFYAVTRTCNDLRGPKVGLTIDSIPSSLDENLDIDAQYFNVFADGLMRYIPDNGLFSRDDDRDVLGTYEKSLRKAKTIHFTEDVTTYTGIGNTDD